MTELKNIQPPAKGQSYNDPAYGTKILRLTDNVDGFQCLVSYSYWSAFNYNSTRLHIGIDNVSYLYDFDAANLRFTKVGSLFSGGDIMQREGMVWSATDPDVIIGLSGYGSAAKIRAYDVAKKQYLWEKDFTKSGELPVGNPWQMSKSRVDDDYYAFGWRSMDAVAFKYCVIFDRRLNKTYKLDLQAAGGMSDFDEARISAEGKIVFFGNGKEYHFWTYATQKPEQRTIVAYNATERGDGHFDIGSRLFCQPDTWGANGNRIIGRQLSSPKQWTELYDSGVKDWNQSHHVSLLGPTEDWALITSNALAPDYSLPAMNEIFLVKTDGSGRIKELCQHRSSCSIYEAQPHANLSPDGRFFAYSSDWGGHLDVYIGVIPDGIFNASALPSPQPAPVPQPTPEPTPSPVPPKRTRKPVVPPRRRGRRL